MYKEMAATRRAAIKQLRKDTDDVICDVENMKRTTTDQEYPPEHGRSLALARTKLQEAKMWMGQAIGALELNPDPFPTELRDLSDKR